jgi:putative endonuclease
MPGDARVPDPRSPRPRNPDRQRRLGALGEDAAAAWYVARGFEVLDRNWRVREGEIDLVLRAGRVVVFCEVKTRSSDRFGTPAESVTATKQRRLRTLASRWFAAHPSFRGEVRFDVASVTPGGESPAVSVLEAAF